MEQSNKNIVAVKTLDGEIRSYDKNRISEIEEVLVLRPHRVKPAYESVRVAQPGEKINIGGIDKIAGIMDGQLTLDLNAKIPENKKRKAPTPEQVAIIKDSSNANFFYQLRQLEKKVNELAGMVDTLTTFLKKK